MPTVEIFVKKKTAAIANLVGREESAGTRTRALCAIASQGSVEGFAKRETFLFVKAHLLAATEGNALK